jgi:serine/threonine protein kinase
MIRAVTEQLQGLAQALRVTHYLIGIDGRYPNEPYIHGDLKPKNILWFQEGGEIGTLKIGDWGNAKKVHGANTATRTNGSGNYGTRRYEPPEVETGTIIDGSDSTQDSRSRLYDLWSFGCFTLEFIIWLLHGKKGLDQFHRDKKGDYGISDSFYEIDPHAKAKVHGVVDHWMDSMEKDPLCCIGESALGDLLDVVRQGLLVVKLPKGGGSINARVETYPRFLGQDLELQRDDSRETDPNGTDIPKISTLIVPGVQKESSLELTHLLLGTADSSEIKIVVTKDDSHQARESMHTRHESIESVESPLPNDGVFQPERFRAIELESNLCRIFQSHESAEYWYKDVPHQPMPSTFRKQPLQLSSKIPGNYDGPRKDPEDWRFSIDNAFAATLFEKLDKNLLLPKDSPVTTSLCEKCSETFGEEITSPFFSVTYSTSRLSMNANANRCELCVLLWQVCKDYTSTEHTTVQFDRRGSKVQISHRRAPVLSLFCDYGTQICLYISRCVKLF